MIVRASFPTVTPVAVITLARLPLLEVLPWHGLEQVVLLVGVQATTLAASAAADAVGAWLALLHFAMMALFLIGPFNRLPLLDVVVVGVIETACLCVSTVFTPSGQLPGVGWIPDVGRLCSAGRVGSVLDELGLFLGHVIRGLLTRVALQQRKQVAGFNHGWRFHVETVRVFGPRPHRPYSLKLRFCLGDQVVYVIDVLDL